MSHNLSIILNQNISNETFLHFSCFSSVIKIVFFCQKLTEPGARMTGVLRGIFFLHAIFAFLSAESSEKKNSSDDEKNPNGFMKVVNNEELLDDFTTDHIDLKDDNDPAAKGRIKEFQPSNFK